MPRIRACLIASLVAGGMTLVPITIFAQEIESAGYVQITDSPNGPPVGSPCPDGNCRNDSYGGSYCPPGGYGHGRGHHGTGYRMSLPVKRPIYRSPVSYTKGFPDAWTGYGPPAGTPAYRAPTVYMPTDTTQLGYYYQTVPYWQPKPGAVPPPPVPSQWHTTVDQMYYQGNHPAGIIYGTAPTAVPNSPTPPPRGPRGVPPEPTPATNPVVPTQATSQSAALERAESSPSLMPIE